MPSYIHGTRTKFNRNDTCVGLDSHGNASSPPRCIRPSDRADVSIGLFSAPKSSSDHGKQKLFSPVHHPGLNKLKDGPCSTPKKTPQRISGLAHKKRAGYPQRQSDIDRSDLFVGLDAGARAGAGKDELVVSVTSKGLKQNKVMVVSEGQEPGTGWMRKKTKKVLSGLGLQRKE
ncbi:hypothetical protein BDU57DRAFT_536496 [Ampelomyces quisqualis]|uniref:Uncharacterized protein n=1 Tax=Ampelomyces quisqualis TaxID=50730 RepID=A0A6A5QUP2_AMPQU|nr:hypothetical protein BDU57DRAFT_536496 [Ampelomyces quisqualis]